MAKRALGHASLRSQQQGAPVWLVPIDRTWKRRAARLSAGAPLAPSRCSSSSAISTSCGVGVRCARRVVVQPCWPNSNTSLRKRAAPPPPPRPRVPHLQHPTQAFGAAVAARPQALMHALIHFGVLLARCCCQRFCVRAGSHARAVTVGWCTLARPEQRAEQRNAPGGGGRDARAASATAVHQPATCAGLAAPRAASQQRAVGRRVAKASCGGPRSCAHESRGRGSMPHTHAHSCPVGGFGAIHMRHACERGTNHQHHAPRGLTPLTLGQLVGGVRRAQCSLPAAAAHRRAPWGRLEQRDLGALRRARTGGLSVCLV